MRRRISPTDGHAALAAWLTGEATPTLRRMAARYCLEELAARAPGNSVEVRVPPAGVTQVIEGPRHTRGTPPNVVEMNEEVWLNLCVGRTQWATAVAQGEISASGTRADLGTVMPLWADSDSVIV